MRGVDDYHAGVAETDAPWPEGTPEGDEWFRGFGLARENDEAHRDAGQAMSSDPIQPRLVRHEGRYHLIDEQGRPIGAPGTELVIHQTGDGNLAVTAVFLGVEQI